MAIISSPASAITADYASGVTTLKANQDGFEFEIRDEVANPGSDVKVYFSPSTVNGVVNCVSATIDGTSYDKSSVTGVKNLTRPSDGTTVVIMSTPIMYSNPLCYTDKWGNFNVDTVVEGTAKYKIWGTLRNYVIEVTFGPDPANPGKTVVRRLRTDSF